MDGDLEPCFDPLNDGDLDADLLEPEPERDLDPFLDKDFDRDLDLEFLGEPDSERISTLVYELDRDLDPRDFGESGGGEGDLDALSDPDSDLPSSSGVGDRE